MCVRQPFSIGGSGSTYVYGYVDATYKEGMTEKQCLEFTSNTLRLVGGFETRLSVSLWGCVRKLPVCEL